MKRTPLSLRVFLFFLVLTTGLLRMGYGLPIESQENWSKLSTVLVELKTRYQNKQATLYALGVLLDKEKRQVAIAHTYKFRPLRYGEVSEIKIHFQDEQGSVVLDGNYLDYHVKDEGVERGVHLFEILETETEKIPENWKTVEVSQVPLNPKMKPTVYGIQFKSPNRRALKRMDSHQLRRFHVNPASIDEKEILGGVVDLVQEKWDWKVRMSSQYERLWAGMVAFDEEGRFVGFVDNPGEKNNANRILLSWRDIFPGPAMDIFIDWEQAAQDCYQIGVAGHSVTMGVSRFDFRDGKDHQVLVWPERDEDGVLIACLQCRPASTHFCHPTYGILGLLEGHGAERIANCYYKKEMRDGELWRTDNVNFEGEGERYRCELMGVTLEWVQKHPFEGNDFALHGTLHMKRRGLLTPECLRHFFTVLKHAGVEPCGIQESEKKEICYAAREVSLERGEHRSTRVLISPRIANPKIEKRRRLLGQWLAAQLEQKTLVAEPEIPVYPSSGWRQFLRRDWDLETLKGMLSEYYLIYQGESDDFLRERFYESYVRGALLGSATERLRLGLSLVDEEVAALENGSALYVSLKLVRKDQVQGSAIIFDLGLLLRQDVRVMTEDEFKAETKKAFWRGHTLTHARTLEKVLEVVQGEHRVLMRNFVPLSAVEGIAGDPENAAAWRELLEGLGCPGGWVE